MKITVHILLLIFCSGQMSGQTAAAKTIYGTYVSYKWGCCFSCNCGTKYILTLKKDSSYILEQFKYTSPIKGKWWKYTLDNYGIEQKSWSVNNDTLIFPADNLVDARLLIKNGKLIRASDYVLTEIYGSEFMESNPQIKERQFIKKRFYFEGSRKIKKHIWHRD